MQLDTFDRRALRILGIVFRVKAILHRYINDSLDRRIQSVRIIGVPTSTKPVNGGGFVTKYIPDTLKLLH